ncbi:leucine-rich repeat domain-containing protein [uncultured Ruminococcus sp.]|uniref:leucine-rich repeat domain-containing protein n=1 Tax=uncultured Ruminococcus sp. TaxID=165186 RepID=UPI00266CE184|nr:leucine-rich repeat domain-containing protein [uncultured Ruminococcus sp.]
MKESLCPCQIDENAARKDCGQISPITDFEIEDGVLKEYLGNSEIVAIPDDITSIGDNAFWNCSSLISIHIPDSVTSIGDEAFFGCASLESIKIPKSVTHIGRNAFPVDAKIIRV